MAIEKTQCDEDKGEVGDEGLIGGAHLIARGRGRARGWAVAREKAKQAGYFE